MMISVVYYVYVEYILSLNYSGTDIPKIEQTFQSQQKVKRLKLRLSDGIFFEKNMSEYDSSCVPSDE